MNLWSKNTYAHPRLSAVQVQSHLRTNGNDAPGSDWAAHGAGQPVTCCPRIKGYCAYPAVEIWLRRRHADFGGPESVDVTWAPFGQSYGGNTNSG